MSVLEVTSSAFILAVGVLGVMTGVVHQRNLERSTDRLWASTTAAASAMEDIRAAADARWDSATDWDGETVDPAVDHPDSAALRAIVSDDPGDLPTPDGMWSVGATDANFFFVRVDTDSDDAEFANTLRLQTYVADRGGLRPGGSSSGVTESPTETVTRDGDEAAPGWGGGDSIDAPSFAEEAATASGSNYAEAPAAATSEAVYEEPVAAELVEAASHVSPHATGTAVTGTSPERLSFALTNDAATDLALTSVEVGVGDEGMYTFVQIAGGTFYDNASNPEYWGTLTPAGGSHGIAPGIFTVFIDAVAEDPSSGSPFTNQATTLTLTFSDGSTAAITVTP